METAEKMEVLSWLQRKIISEEIRSQQIIQIF